MQIAKKDLTEGLVQLTIFLSLIGVRVDIDSYLNGYYTPLIEINLGPSSAYTQTPFHNLRDTLDGYSVHPKCPELDYFFASRRLLDDVRSLGSPRFPTQLNAWLVHQVSATDKAECGQASHNNSSDSNSTTTAAQSPQQQAGDDSEHLPDSGHEGGHTDLQLGAGPGGAGACGFSKERNDDIKIKEEDEPVPLTLAHSSILEQESLFEGITALSNPTSLPAPNIESDQTWSQLLPLSVSDLEDLDSLVSARLPGLDTDIVGAISQDVSLHDAMMSSGVFEITSGRAESQAVTQQHRRLSRSESTGSSHSDPSPGMALGLAALPFASVCNFTGNSTSQSHMGGSLDEAVFDEINQLGLEALDTIDNQLLGSLEYIDPQLLEDFDSDSGLSLESSSGGPVSPGSSEISSSSSSFCEDECGATGYSSEVDSIPSKGLLDYSTTWPPLDLRESVWHDHSYASPAPVTYSHKRIKEEPLSNDKGPKVEDRDMSRDEMRARAMCIPFSVLQIVNMPVEEFLEVLDSHGFSPEQVTLLRDIRRRGKNKLAAQNCRKRKLDAITGLQEDVARLHAQRARLLREKQLTAKTMCAVGHQIKQLTRDVLSRLRDPLGQPLSPDRYSLQCGANGRVVVEPVRRPPVSGSSRNKTDKRKKGKKQ